MNRIQPANQEVREFEEKIISLDRVTRVVKGGRRFRFRATVVVGDGKGRVGVGVGKGGDAPTSIIKAIAKAKTAMINFDIDGTTIPHETQISFGGANVFMKPAGPGTGVIAGGAVRAVVEVAGIKDLLTKSLGSSNKINNAYATIEALRSLGPVVKSSDTITTKTDKPTTKVTSSKQKVEK